MTKKPTKPGPYPGISEGGKSRQVAFNTLSPKPTTKPITKPVDKPAPACPVRYGDDI